MAKTQAALVSATLNMLKFPHLPAAGGGLAEEVVDHVELVLLHHYEALLLGLLSVDVRGPLDKERVEMVHPGWGTQRARIITMMMMVIMEDVHTGDGKIKGPNKTISERPNISKRSYRKH